MAVRPEGSPLTFTQVSPSVTANVVIESITKSYDVQFFDRLEFSHDKLRQAKNSDGSVPIYLQMFGGRVAQLSVTCGTTSARPLTPDDSDVDNIKKRFDITRYTINGGVSTAADVNKLFAIASAHKILLDRFDAHIAEVNMDISYSLLVTLQSETFSFLTSTGLTVSGPTIDSGDSSLPMLIRAFSMGVEYEIPNDATPTSSTIYKSFSMTLDNLVIVPASSTSP